MDDRAGAGFRLAARQAHLVAAGVEMAVREHCPDGGPTGPVEDVVVFDRSRRG
ncbi:hypothetical protein [Amycolatopsis sp. GA6-003]|uniref:hypothetical protein n=1 Tax=Amycolatopsis sp. GA6-003 TaxID=2652444 RepID=UPI003916FF43